MGSANRGTAIAPLSTIGTRYGNSVSTALMPPKPMSKLSLKWLATAENQGEKPIRNFSIDPASSIRTSIADPVFADPVSAPIFHTPTRIPPIHSNSELNLLLERNKSTQINFRLRRLSVGRTAKGSYSPRGRSRHLLETPFSEPPSENPSQNSFFCEPDRKRLPSQNPYPEPFPEPSQNPS